MNELKEQILQYLDSHKKGKRRIEDIQDGLNLHSSSDFAKLSKALDEMEESYDVFLSEGRQYQTRDQAGIVEGRISINRAGAGFLDFEDRDSIRISDKDLNTALNGDTVLVQCHPWQNQGKVIAVVKRDKDHIIGTYVNNGHGLHFMPDDEKIAGKLFRISVPDDFTPVEGMKVLCTIEDYRTPMKLQLKECIGYKDDPGVDITSILLDRNIISEFPEEVMDQVKHIPQEVLPEECEGRTDLTNVPTVTIDGDDSKDFDDAVSVEKTENGWNLKVSIADVSHYVTEDSPLDKEALKRGCSTYVTDRVVPMLPHELSNGICSLNPHVVRLTNTCDMNIDHDGNVSDYKIYPSYIRSFERMTYHNVNLILDGDEEMTENYSHLGSLFYDLRDCADAIRKHRTEKGAIAFNSTESEIKVDEKGHPYYVGPKERGHAEEMIEDCMIAANVCVANFMKWQEIPCIYRIHEEPQARRIKSFVMTSEFMGHKLVLGKSDIHPKEIQTYLESVSDTPEYPVLSTLLLRCMQKAKYDNVCVGHFGLAEEEYLHFTSPIRRYPDLIVHRMLRKYSYEGCTDLNERSVDEEKTADYALQSSVRERASADAEFACDDMKKAEYMEDHIGMKSEGIITGVQPYGFYVELPDTIEGLVRAADMHDDYYSYDADRMQLKGQRTHRIFRIGMKVHVECISASKETSSIDFRLIGKNGRVLPKKEERRHSKHSDRRKHQRVYRKGNKSHGRRKK